MTVSPSSINEAGGVSTVAVSTGGATFPTERAIALVLSGTAEKDTDYTVGPETLTLPAGATEVETTVTAVQDTVDDDAETIVIAAALDGAAVGEAQTITIIDDDVETTVTPLESGGGT